jgi:hypothetical protein
VLIATPLALVAVELWEDKLRFSTFDLVEACAIVVELVTIGSFVLSGHLPFAYIIMPPLLGPQSDLISKARRQRPLFWPLWSRCSRSRI